MAFSLDSKVKDILKNPEAAAVLDKYSPDASKNPQMKLVGGLTLRKLASGCMALSVWADFCLSVQNFLKRKEKLWKNWKKSFRQSNNLQKRSSLQFGDCFFF